MYFIVNWNICIMKEWTGLTLCIFLSCCRHLLATNHLLLLDDPSSDVEDNAYPPSAWYNASWHLSLVSLDKPISLKQKLNSLLSVVVLLTDPYNSFHGKTIAISCIFINFTLGEHESFMLYVSLGNLKFTFGVS